MGSTARARLSRRVRARLAAEGGFTLPELLTAMAILLIVLTSLTSVLVSATHTEVDANRRFQAQEQARTGLSLLRLDLHCASSVVDTSDGILLTDPTKAGIAVESITATLGSQCPSTGLAATSPLTTYATWCTSPSTLTTGDYALYRVTSTALPLPTCGSTGKVKRMDYLTTQTPFCMPSTTAACSPPTPGVLRPSTSLPMLHVTFPLNLNGPASTTEGYNLFDDIALRNGTRS